MIITLETFSIWFCGHFWCQNQLIICLIKVRKNESFKAVETVWHLSEAGSSVAVMLQWFLLSLFKYKKRSLEKSSNFVGCKMATLSGYAL